MLPQFYHWQVLIGTLLHSLSNTFFNWFHFVAGRRMECQCTRIEFLEKKLYVKISARRTTGGGVHQWHLHLHPPMQALKILNKI